MMAALMCLCMLSAPTRIRTEKYVALTFDDGPSGRYTRHLLEGIRERDVKATFLLCGYRIAQYPELTEQLFREGHEIGYHGYSHSPMNTMSRRDIARELENTRALLPENCEPVFLRPPGGQCSDAVIQVAKARQIAVLSWSVDPRDWATRDPIAVESAVLGKVQDGDIILLHDMTDSSVRATLEIIDSLKKEGFRFVTVSELADLRGEDIVPGGVYRCFPPKEKKVK
jgi:peptidoglycan/xylan/chitin deacetylase (PgdA/CDA1 family)